MIRCLKSFVGGVMDYDYLSSIVSNYSNLTSLSALGGSTLGSNAALKGVSALLNSGDSLDMVGTTNSLVGANTFSTILESALKATDGSASDVESSLSEEAAEKLVDIAGAGTDSALEGEARSNMILQNYLYTAMMKDSLDNSLTEKADFTSGLFSNLAVGTEDEDSSSVLGTITNSTLGAISNYSSYKTLLDNSDFSELADDVVSSYNGQGSLLKEMLTSLSSELKSTQASEETQAHSRNFDSHLRLRSAAYRRA